jgi:penicillin-binding protein 1A
MRSQRLTRSAARIPARRRPHRLRWIILGVFFVAVLLTVAAVRLAGPVLDLAQGTPALSSLLQRVPAQTTLIFDSRGRLIAQLHGAIDRVDVSSAQIPAYLKHATIAVEDKRLLG